MWFAFAGSSAAAALAAGQSFKAPEEPQESDAPIWPVAGVYTVADTKDVGKLLGLKPLEGLKVRGWVDFNYTYNFNQPSSAVVDANNGASTVKGSDVNVEGRLFDIHHNSFQVLLAELELELVPEKGGVGFKLDIAYGETQDILFDTISAMVASPGAVLTPADRVFQHASITYIAPIGNGLRIDAGKFVTHVGGETIETIKNWNYSHGLLYTYAIPWQETGIHVGYRWYDMVFTDLYVLNGWNVTIDNNQGKTIGVSVGTPSVGNLAEIDFLESLQIFVNYYVGDEQPAGGWDQLRHLVDLQVFYSVDQFNFEVSFDYATDKNVLGAALKDSVWWGVALYAKYRLNDTIEPSMRLEYFYDQDGTRTGLANNILKSITVTLNVKIPYKSAAMYFRPEFRYDNSSQRMFSKESTFRGQEHQITLGAGATWTF